MTRLSKSKLLAFRQCSKRLWLEVHKPELRKTSASAQRTFDAGHTVGRIAQQLYAPDGNADLIDVSVGHSHALARTEELVQRSRRPIFEAGFTAEGVLAYADVLLPVGPAQRRAWRMVEVKSSTAVKDYHREDAAIQAYLARTSGLPLEGISLATVDTKFVYPGQEDYKGLLKETDLTDETLALAKEVATWIPAAHAVAEGGQPTRRIGSHCNEPFECGFVDRCSTGLKPATYPVQWLPRVQSKPLVARLQEPEVSDMADVPDELLNDVQKRVKQHTLADTCYFDRAGAKAAISACSPPLHALDFETIAFVVPVWPGTSPYEAVPFQYSYRSLLADGALEHKEFLDLSGADPARALAEALIVDCAGEGPILMYSDYERKTLNQLARRFPDLAEPLKAIAARLFDLLPVARNHYYHPSQHGSWSIKSVLPALGGQGYTGLQVAGGQQAMDFYLIAIRPVTSEESREEIRADLLEYCGRDTQGLLYLWREFSGRADLVL